MRTMIRYLVIQFFDIQIHKIHRHKHYSIIFYMDSHTHKRKLTLQIPGEDVGYILKKPKLRREKRIYFGNDEYRTNIQLVNKNERTSPNLTPIPKILDRYHDMNK